jgi:predicted RNase H-like nuclease
LAKYFGLDGFRQGWVAAWIEDSGDHGFSYSRSAAELLSGPFERAMIDVPIGLPERGYRLCDREAKKLVGSAVFLGVRRNIWAFADCDAANEFYWQSEGRGRGISRQLWGIRGKVQEIDEFISPQLQGKVMETHPEVVFWKLAGEKAFAKKKSAEGRAERIRILKENGFTQIDSLMVQRKGSGIGRDDLIDACVCAIAARDAKHILGGDLDSRGLRMEMHY